MTEHKTTKMKTKIQNRLDALKAKAEHLNVQLHLGAAEAKDEFEKQKKNLKVLVDNVQDRLKDVKDLGEDKATNLKATIEELRVQAALGKADTADALDDQAKKINKGIHSLKQQLSKSAHKAEETAHHITEDTKEQLDDLHTQVDLMRLRAHLGKMEASDTWDEKKKEIKHKLNDFNQKLDQGKDLAEDRWEHFSEEIAEAWSHVKNAFKV